MNTCSACGSQSQFAISINGSIEGTQVRDLVGLYLHLEVNLNFSLRKFSSILKNFQTAPGYLISNYLCQRCVKTLMDCHQIKKRAEFINLPVPDRHASPQLKLTPFAAVYPHTPASIADMEDSRLIYYRSFSYQGDLEHPSDESETYERSSNSSLDTFRDAEKIRYNRFRNNINNSSTLSDLRQKEREPDHQPRTFTDAAKSPLVKDFKHELESNESAASFDIMAEPLFRQNEQAEDTSIEEEDNEVAKFNNCRNITSDLFFIRLGD